MTEFEPKQFGKYYLLEKLAVGGMAEIYKSKTFGVDGFEKLLVIKRILPHCAADKEFITMLIDEAKLSVLLSHANIVQVFDLGKVGEDYFIAMEFIHGINLRDILYRNRDSGKPLAVDISAYVVSEICKGLDYAHRKTDNQNKPLGIVHRDISPQNILISYEGEVKIVDFGIAKAAMNISHTMAGMLKGKIAYMSPEQATGQKIDQRTDIFSTGILLYEMLTGQKLYTGETQFEVLKKIRSEQITEKDLPEHLPAGIRKILAKALAFDVDQRYQSAGDLQTDLTRFLYTAYSDFSPRRLSNYLKEMFAEEMQTDRASSMRVVVTEQQTASMSIRESERQVELVHNARAGEITAPGGNITRTAMRSSVPGMPPHGPKSSGGKKAALTLLLLAAITAIGAGSWWLQRSTEPAAEVPPLENPQTAQDLPSNIPPQTQASTGTLFVNSDPSGAAISVNGTSTNLFTPATLQDLQLNQDLKITLSKPDFENYDQVVNLTNNKPQQLNSILKKIQPTSGEIMISSAPAGASIFLNGISTGRTTPATLSNLALQQEYTVEVQMKGFTSWKQNVRLTSPTAENLSAQLKPESTPVKVAEPSTANQPVAKKTPPPVKQPVEKPVVPPVEKTPPPPPEQPTETPRSGSGKLVLASDPSGADVFINAEHQGKTPLTVTVPAGRVSVLVSKEGLARYSKKITINPGDTVKITDIKLGDLYGEVSIVSTPPRSTVYFDGQEIPAKTPVTIRRVRTDQEHSIKVTHDGFQQWSRSFSMDGEKKKSFNVTLEQ